MKQLSNDEEHSKILKTKRLWKQFSVQPSSFQYQQTTNQSDKQILSQSRTHFDYSDTKIIDSFFKCVHCHCDISQKQLSQISSRSSILSIADITYSQNYEIADKAFRNLRQYQHIKMLIQILNQNKNQIKQQLQTMREQFKGSFNTLAINFEKILSKQTKQDGMKIKQLEEKLNIKYQEQYNSKPKRSSFPCRKQIRKQTNGFQGLKDRTNASIKIRQLMKTTESQNKSTKFEGLSDKITLETKIQKNRRRFSRTNNIQAQTNLNNANWNIIYNPKTSIKKKTINQYFQSASKKRQYQNKQNIGDIGDIGDISSSINLAQYIDSKSIFMHNSQYCWQQ